MENLETTHTQEEINEIFERVKRDLRSFGLSDYLSPEDDDVIAEALECDHPINGLAGLVVGQRSDREFLAE